MPRIPGFVGGSYESQSTVAAGERTVNLIVERVPVGGKTQASLYPAPGLVEFATMPKAPGRGIFFERGRLYTVYGDTLYELDQHGTVTARGDVAVDGNPATLSTDGDGGEELLVTSGGRGDILDLVTNTFLPGEVTDITFSGQVDGFFVGLDAEISTLKISESLDGQTWDGTQIAQRTAASDPWLAMIIVRREIYLFGEKTGEVWYNAGRSPFPFAQRPGAFFEIGIAAPFSLSKFGGTMAWLGKTEHDNGGVYWMNGYSPEEISTPAVRWAIQQYEDAGDISNAIGWSYAREGHEFYVLTFPGRSTWVYDRSTNVWTEFGFWSNAANAFLAYRPQHHAMAFGKNLVCDSGGNKIYALSSTVFTDVDGDEMRRLRRFRGPWDRNRRVTCTYAELECDRGVGLAQGQGANPLVALRYSRTGGKTWGDNRERSVGRIGEYDTRVRWDSLGQGRDWMFELWSSDPVATRWFDFHVGAR